MKLYVCILTIALHAAAWADTSSPERAIHQLEDQLNGRQLDALMGPIDYELVYVGSSPHAYPLESLHNAQQRKRQLDAQSGREELTGRFSRDWQPVLVKEININETGPVDVQGRPLDNIAAPSDSSVVPDRDRTKKEIKKGDRGRDRAAGKLSTDRGRVRAKSRTKHISVVAHPDKAVGPNPPKVRFYKDRAGDPHSFDLVDMNVNALVNRKLPKRYRDRGMKLGVMLAPPSKYEGPKVSRIEQEHSLAKRRVMRLRLREIWQDIPVGVYLSIQIDELETNEDQAMAQVTWSFTDQEESQTSSLDLQQAETGWQVERGWDFIQELAAARAAVE